MELQTESEKVIQLSSTDLIVVIFFFFLHIDSAS